MRKYLKKAMLLLAASLLLSVFHVTAIYAADYKLKVGSRMDVSRQDASYQSSDESIAFVSQDGFVTAKKAGIATITVTKNGKKTPHRLTVKKNAKKPGLKVAADEIAIPVAKLTLTSVDTENEVLPGDMEQGNRSEDGAQEIQTGDTARQLYTYEVNIRLKNTNDHAVASVYLITRVGGETFEFYTKPLEGGESKTFTKSVTLDHEAAEVEIVRLRVRTGGMYHICNYETGNTAYEYATEDTTAPKITGLVGKKSYDGDVPYQTIYKDRAKSFDYFKYVKASDDRDTEVDLEVDTSRVDFSKKGTYRITYIATDSSGNITKVPARIAVRVNDETDELADRVLKSIIKTGWSDQKKVTAIYNYAHSHIRYSHGSDKTDWEKEARRGIRQGRGDCWTYHSVVRLLLSRAGIPNLGINRVSGSVHWWNMAYVGTGFYHVDACPRRSGGKLCLLTDKQLKTYSKYRGNNSHIWDYANKPKSATKVIAYY